MYKQSFYDDYKPLVPYMPLEPSVGYGYIPYQVNPSYFDDFAEAHYHGTIFPELVDPYSEYIQRGVINEK